MKSNERPVVLTDIRSAISGFNLIRLAFSSSAIGTGAMLAIGASLGETPLWVGVGMAPALLVAGAIGLHRSMRFWTRGLTSPQLLVHLQNDEPLAAYRLLMPISVVLLVIGIWLSLTSTDKPSSLVMTGTMFCCLWGGLEWFRRSARRRARILFTLYADGVLSPEETAAVDAERRQSAEFDAAVRSFQQWNAAVAELSRVEAGS